MSRAIQISITRIKKLFSAGKCKITQIPAVGLNEIPSISELAIPSVASLSASIPHPETFRESSLGLDKSKESAQHLSVGMSTEESKAFEDDLHTIILSLLKENGYLVDEVRELPSGGRLITVADVVKEFKQNSSHVFVNKVRS